MSQKIYSNLDIKGNATIGDITNATSDTDKFLVSDAGVVKYRTGSEMLSDLGVAPGVASNIQHQVKAGVAINKGQAVYVTGADGTNMIVGLASNAAEVSSSKTMGLMASTVAINGFGNVIAEGLLAGLNTSTANAGDPVWLGTGGNLIYGIVNKPYAPSHLVFIGIVTRSNTNNGEIFVKVQNGFELDELHDADLKTTTPINGHILGYNGTLWVNKTIAGWLGYTPANANGTANYISKFTGATTLGNSLIYDNGTNILIGTTTDDNYAKLKISGGAISIGNNQQFISYRADGLPLSIFKVNTSNQLVFNPSWGQAVTGYSFTTSGSEKLGVSSGGSVTASGDMRAPIFYDSDNTAYYLNPADSSNLYDITANKFVKSGGTSAQILAADGSVITAGSGITISGGTISSTGGTFTETDTLATVTGRGNTTTSNITVGSLIIPSFETATNVLSFRSGIPDGTNVGIRAKAIVTANRDALELLGYNGIDFTTNNGATVAMRISINGNIHVGGSSSSYKFHVAGGQYGTYLKGGDLGTGSDILRLVDASNNTKYLARGDGKHFFTGDTEVSGALTVSGTLTASGYNKTNWDTAFGWGNHASAGYLTSETNTFLGDGGNADTHPGTDRIIFTGQISTGAALLGMPATDNSNAILNINRHPGEYNSQLGFSSNGSMYYRSFSATAINSSQAWRQVWDSGNFTNNSTNWNTAYSWGNHASAGYVPQARTITINGTSYDLSANRSWTVSGTDSTKWPLEGSWKPASLASSTRLRGATSPDGGEFALAYSGGQIHPYADGFFYQNEGAYRVMDSNSIGDYTVGNYRTIADYSSDSTWYMRPNGRFVFANAHDWTQTFELYLPSGGSNNNTWAHFGQRQSNATNGNFTGVSIRRYISGASNLGDLQAGNVYGRIFYDDDNTGYYLNPASTSNLSGLTVANTISGSVSGSAASAFSMPYDGNAISGMGPISTWDSRPGVGMAGFGINWHTGVSISGYPGYGGVRLYASGYPTHSSSVLRLEASDSIKTYGILYNNESVRSPVFYDSNNTGYYVDPSSISYLSSLRISDASSGASLIVGTNDTSRVYSDDPRKQLAVNADYYPCLYVNALSNNGNTTHGAVISMSGNLNSGGYRRWGMGIANTNPGVFSIGYADNNSNPHYGVGGSGWSQFWIGTGGDVYATDSFRSPIFYDSNNTGRYVDPAGTSSVADISLNGAIYFPGSGTTVRIQESYGVLVNCISTPWNFQVINGSSLVGLSASGGNYGIGNGYFTGDVTAYYSDRRLKHNLVSIDNAVEKVKSLNGYTYQHNELGQELLNENAYKVHAGLIAQEVQAVLPEVVTIAPFDLDGYDEQGNGISKSGENYLTIKYERIVPLLIEAIKEQQTQIEELKQLINQLTNK